jgi:hypothetical protein
MKSEIKTIDLLYWVRSRGFTPRNPQKWERFYCPLTRKTFQYGRLRPHQRETALWLPSLRGLKQLGIRVKRELVGMITVVRLGVFLGFGKSEADALLSLFNDIRRSGLRAA